MPVHRSCAARVWPLPEISSNSPSMVNSADLVMADGLTGLPKSTIFPRGSWCSWKTS